MRGKGTHCSQGFKVIEVYAAAREHLDVRDAQLLEERARKAREKRGDQLNGALGRA